MRGCHQHLLPVYGCNTKDKVKERTKSARHSGKYVFDRIGLRIELWEVYSVINIIEVFIGQILNLTALFIACDFPLIPVMR